MAVAGTPPLNLTGTWELDKEKSQTMYSHMILLGCDEIAALASEKLNIRLHIIQTDTRLNVWQQSQLGIVYRGLGIGKDTSEKSSHGDRKVWVSVSEKEVTVDTKFKKGRLLDHRQVNLDPETGEQVMVTSLQLSMRGQPKSTKTTRYFRKESSVPDPEVTSTPKAGVATMTGLAYERFGPDMKPVKDDE